MMKSVVNKLRRLLFLIKNDFLCLFTHRVLVNASLSRGYDGLIIPSNWGDDINWFFLREISESPVTLCGDTLIAKHIATNYLCIGSIIAMCGNRRSVVWGSGLLDGKLPADLRLKEVSAVRGPLTRRALLDAGIPCPEVYGDPALLLPLYYKPDIKKRFRIGIIPHYNDWQCMHDLGEIDTIHQIHINQFSNWLEVIDEILSCEYIISGSLHGLILSEAYGIPSLWIEFNEQRNKAKGNFKYIDFYQSIGKNIDSPFYINDKTTINQLIKLMSDWQPGQIDLTNLIKAAPFPLRKLK